MLQNREPITFKDIGPVREALDRLLINEGGRWQVVVTGNLKQDAPRQVLAGFSHTGPSFIRQELLSILVKDTVIIGLISLTLVNIILYLDFRNVYHVLLCQAPVVVSSFCTLGIMGMTGISLNFMDAIVFVLLFGIGTDYTVHLLHRYLADRDVGTTFLQTGKAVLVAGLTTVAGIGSLGTSSYKGLATMGQVAAAGTTLCVVFSLTLVPALLGLREGRSSR
jgi:predicted RND superfamily exporter protein